MADEHQTANVDIFAMENGKDVTPPGDALPGGDLDLHRIQDLVISAHPDVVPEMIQGQTFEELMSSIEPAREAYQRIANQAASRVEAPKVAAQPGRGSAVADVERLSPLAKISAGLRRR